MASTIISPQPAIDPDREIREPVCIISNHRPLLLGPKANAGIRTMRKYILIFFFVGLTGCQTTGGLNTVYTKNSVPNAPYKSQFSSDVEYAIALTKYTFPRRCVWWSTEDAQKVTADKKPDRFYFTQIIENKYKDGWYMASVTPVESSFGSLTFHVNAKNDKFSCGQKHLSVVAPNLVFENGKFFDVSRVQQKNLPNTVSESVPVSGAKCDIDSPDTCSDMKLCEIAHFSEIRYSHMGKPYINAAENRNLSYDRCTEILGYKSNVSGGPTSPEKSSLDDTTTKTEVVPDAFLAADYDNCMTSASRNQNATQNQIQIYCRCTRDQLKETFDLQKYMEFAMEMQSGNISPSLRSTLSKIGATCASKAFR